MRPFLALICLLSLSVTTCETSTGTARSTVPEKAVTIYDPNPTHIWNRLHATFFIRDDVPSTSLVPDALDPPLWYNTSYLLANPSHRRATHILDEFLSSHAENLIRDPVKRALLQRDLWAVFDWSAEREPERVGNPAYANEKKELQTRLAEVLRRIALTPDEIRSLPDNYAEAVASGQFAKEYDPDHRDRAFLPPDLFDPHGPWIELEGPGDPEPVAEQHFSQFSGRSSFLVFLRLPQGRKATFAYLETLWNVPKPAIPSPNVAPGQEVAPNPALPQFPPGTQVALVRQMTLFDNQGKLVLTPMTQSVQFRVYRAIVEQPQSVPDSSDTESPNSGQDFYEVALSRPKLFAGEAGGLRATGRNEKQFFVFGFAGPDHGRPENYASLDSFAPVVQSCAMCHQGAGVHSLNTRSRLLKPHQLQRDRSIDANTPGWWQDSRTISWKQGRDDWVLLNGYWKTTAPK